jgi:hypothetical protein
MNVRTRNTDNGERRYEFKKGKSCGEETGLLFFNPAVKGEEAEEWLTAAKSSRGGGVPGRGIIPRHNNLVSPEYISVALSLFYCAGYFQIHNSTQEHHLERLG